MKKGLLLVVSGPSGCGKGSILKKLESVKGLAFGISATTRKKRPGELDGVDYYFLDEQDFLRRVENGEMLEYNKYCNNYYGTLREDVLRLLRENDVVVLEIDVNGAKNICSRMDCVKVFILPPSFKVLKERLRQRGTETEFSLLNRLRRAIVEEIKMAYSYDYVVVNNELNKAVQDIKNIIYYEKLGFFDEMPANYSKEYCEKLRVCNMKQFIDSFL